MGSCVSIPDEKSDNVCNTDEKADTENNADEKVDNEEIDNHHNDNQFDKIAEGLKVYYECLGRDHNEISQAIETFLQHCKELEEENINDELAGDAADCALLEPFDVNNFPFLPHVDVSARDDIKREEMLKIIKYCHENYGVPEFVNRNKTNKINEWISQLDRNECIEYEQICRQQLKKTFTQCKDHTFYYGLFLSLKNKFPIIQYLAGVYTRQMIENRLNEEKHECDLSNWLTNTIPVSDKKINIPIIDPADEKGNSNDVDMVSVNNFVSLVLHLYMKRLAPELRWNKSDILIKDNINDVADSISAVINFIKPTQFDGRKFPCQLDFVIAVNDTTKKTSKCTDVIGDVCVNLEQNNCVYHRAKVPHSTLTSKRMNGIYKEFIMLMKQTHDKEYMEHYPQKRRLIAFLDRREIICQLLEKEGKQHVDIKAIKNKNVNTLTFYEPPQDCREFPDCEFNKEYKNNEYHMTEWFMESTRTSIIPQLLKDIDYSKIDDDVKTFMKNKSALTNCEKLLTFSFHIESENEIRCYMWWRGKCMMFLPQDLDDVLPKIFDDSDSFKFDGYANCQWNDEKFEDIYQVLTTNNAKTHLRKYS